jgi:pimeloyl-ACP methyl ester carboxylesterase
MMNKYLEKRYVAIEGEPVLSGRFTYLRDVGPTPAILMAHGLVSSSEEFGQWPDLFGERGIASLAFDFRGHGLSGGERTMHQADEHLEDLRRAWYFLASQDQVDSSKIILMGHSLGTVPLLRLLGAHPDRFLGAILMAPPSQASEAIPVVQKMAYQAAYQVAEGIHRLTKWHLHVPYPYDYPDLFADPEAARQARDRRIANAVGRGIAGKRAWVPGCKGEPRMSDVEDT